MLFYNRVSFYKEENAFKHTYTFRVTLEIENRFYNKRVNVLNNY